MVIILRARLCIRFSTLRAWVIVYNATTAVGAKIIGCFDKITWLVNHICNAASRASATRGSALYPVIMTIGTI